MMGSMGSVANGRLERLDDAAQASLFSNSLALLGTAAAAGERMAISDTSSTLACATLATLLGSDALFGPGSGNATNNTRALSGGLDNLASGKLVGRFPGMGASETSCSGLVVSAVSCSASPQTYPSLPPPLSLSTPRFVVRWQIALFFFVVDVPCF
jgi:hypothetical protein